MGELAKSSLNMFSNEKTIGLITDKVNNLFTSEFSSKMQQEMIGANIWGCDNDNMLSDGIEFLTDFLHFTARQTAIIFEYLGEP